MDNPDAQLFRSHLRVIMLCNALCSSDKKNCEDDADHFLLTLKSVTTTNHHQSNAIQQVAATTSSRGNIIHTIEHDYSTFDMRGTITDIQHQQKNILSYIGGYILYKIEESLCDECCRQAILKNIPEQPEYEWLKLKDYGVKNGGSLKVPSQLIVNLLDAIENVYSKVVENIIHLPKVKSKIHEAILRSLPTLESETAKCCNLGQKVMELYTTIRLHHSLKLLNEELTANPKARCRKLLKLQHL